MSDEVIKAGGIILKKDDSGSQILLLYRGKEEDWSFPKGHVEPGEEVLDTVMRETKEETGLDVEIVRELEPNRYLNTRTGDETVTRMFLLKPRTFEVKTEFERDKLQWIDVDEVIDRLSYDNLKDYYKSVLSEILSQDV